MEVENLIFNVKRTGDTAARGTDRLSNSLQKLRKSSEKAHQGVSKLTSTFGRMTKLMMLRQAIRAFIKAMEEGMKSAYAFNSMAGGEMSSALDALKSAAVQTTGALGSEFGEMIANVAPILISLLNLIGRVANAFSQLTAVLGGRSTYTKAIASSEKWAESTASGAKAAKEWKNQLMGFDEINRLEEPSDSSGGGGGSKPYDGAFELAPAVNEWASKMRSITMDWWNSLDLEPITKAWERLSAAVMDFVSIVDDALYWAYTEVLLPFGKWTIEDALPAGLEMVASFLELINTILRKLSPYLKDFFDNVIKPVAAFIGDTFVNALKWLTEKFESLSEKIEKAKSLKEFIESLDGGEEILVGLATAVSAVVTAFMAWRTVTSIVKTVQGVIGLLGSPTGIAILAITALVAAGIWLYNNWDDIKAQAKKLWEAIKKTWGDIKDWIQEKVDAINEIIKPIGDWFYNHITKPLEDMVDSVKQWLDDFKQTFEDTFGDTLIGRLLGFKSTTNDTAVSVTNDMAAMSDSIFNVYNDGSVLGSLASAFENLGARAHNSLQNIIDGLGHVIRNSGTAVQALNTVNATSVPSAHSSSSHSSTARYASGGFPDEGELFMAREGKMPEMVGRIGNRTAVANNDQIVAAISDGVFSAVVSAMSSSGGNNTPVNIYLDGSIIAKSTTKYQRQYARAGTM